MTTYSRDFNHCLYCLNKTHLFNFCGKLLCKKCIKKEKDKVLARDMDYTKQLTAHKLQKGESN